MPPKTYMVNPGREVEEYKRTSWLLVVTARLLSFLTTGYCLVVLVVPDWSAEPLFSVPVVPAVPSEPASDLLSVLLLSLEVLESDDVLELSDDPVVAPESDEPPVAASGVD